MFLAATSRIKAGLVNLPLKLLVVSLFCLLQGCDIDEDMPTPAPDPRPALPQNRPKPPHPAPTATPPKISFGKMTKSASPYTSNEAMTIADVSLMLRTGFEENTIVEEVKFRGLLHGITPKEVTDLTAEGATQYLLRTLGDPDYILTDSEAAKYEARMKEKAVAALQAKTHSTIVFYPTPGIKNLGSQKSGPINKSQPNLASLEQEKTFIENAMSSLVKEHAKLNNSQAQNPGYNYRPQILKCTQAMVAYRKRLIEIDEAILSITDPGKQ